MSIRWNFDSRYSFSNDNFAKIYRFFVIETPVEGVSQRGKSFEQRGWNLKSLNAAIKRSTSFLKSEWYVCTVKEIENKMREYGIFNSVKLPREFAIHTAHNNSNTEGLFYAIRCAFAHGAFSLHTCSGERYYFFENKDRDKYKGRIVIKESSLISIIDTVESEINNISTTRKTANRKTIKRKESLSA